MDIHSIVLQQREGEGKGAEDKDIEIRSAERDNMKMGIQRRGINKWWRNGRKKLPEGKYEGHEDWRVCLQNTFQTPRRGCAVSHHYLRGAAEMQLSYGYFLCLYLYRPTKTNHPFPPHTLSNTSSKVQILPPFLSCFFLTLNLTKKMEKRQKISYKLWKLAQLYLTGWVKHAVSEQAPLLRENLLNPPPCSVISAFNRQCWTSRWSALTVWRQSL